MESKIKKNTVHINHPKPSKKSFVFCPLCKSKAFLFQKIEEKKYYQCATCRGVFLTPEKQLSSKNEKKRYEKHQNDVQDPGYRNFVMPLVDKIIRDFSPKNSGLDFGCGRGPVAAQILSEKNYQVQLYDPIFQPVLANLAYQYDYIICCEVMEHFYHPKEEFQRLASLLQSQGKLYCKTNLLSEKILQNFKTWWYKNDPTHVFFYSQETLNYISTEFKFTSVKIEEEVIIFSR